MEPLGGALVEGVSPRPWASAVRHVQWRWHLIATLGWATALGLSQVLEVQGVAHDLALALHLLGLVVGFGAVLLVDWHGLVWLSGLRTFRETLRVGEAAHPLVWMGLLLVIVSGAFLGPDLGDTRTWVKQAAVLALVNNGVGVRRLGARLSVLRPRILAIGELPVRHRVAVGTSLVVSQLAWWTAAVIGFLVTLSRR